MEERKAHIQINKAGGTAGETSKNYRISLPSLWMKKMGIDEENKEVCIQFDGEAKKKKHPLTVLYFYYEDTLCTKICADYQTQKVAIQNETKDVLRRAFGVEAYPTWTDYMDFLRERCVPETRDGISFYLKELGLEVYEPLEIIRKTEGRMAEDNHWIRIMEG